MNSLSLLFNSDIILDVIFTHQIIHSIKSENKITNVDKCDNEQNYFISNEINYLKTLTNQQHKLLEAKITNFTDYKMLNGICKVLIGKDGYCNVSVAKIFVVVLSSHFNQESFLEEFPAYKIFYQNNRFSQATLLELEKKEIRTFNTFQVLWNECIFQCNLVWFFGTPYYYWNYKCSDWCGYCYILFNLNCNGVILGKTIFELLYKLTKD